MVKEYINNQVIDEWSTFDNNLDRIRDKVDADLRTKIVLGEIMRRTVGFTRKEDSKNLTGYWCSPRRVSISTGVQYWKVLKAYDELAERKIIFKSKRYWGQKPGSKSKRECTWVEVNLNLDEWVLVENHAQKPTALDAVLVG